MHNSTEVAEKKVGRQIHLFCALTCAWESFPLQHCFLFYVPAEQETAQTQKQQTHGDNNT